MPRLFVVRPGSPSGVSNRWYSEWGQQYEHRGVIVQENLSPIRNEPSDLSPPTSKLAISPPPGKLSFELKANVAFGQLGLAGLFILPKAESVHLDISFCRPGRISCTGRRCVGGRGVCAAYCKRAVGMLQVIAQPLTKLARELSSALAADWIRLDIFVSEPHGAGSLSEQPITPELW